MAQAVSDLSAEGAPSQMLWEQLSALYDVCGIVSVMAVCIHIQRKGNRHIRLGIYLFALMSWVSLIGYQAFPLTGQGDPSVLQNTIHIFIVTPAVVLLSIVSLILIMVGDYHKKANVGLAAWASIALGLIFLGAIGTGIVPPKYFSIPERFSVFAATGFNAALGVYLFQGKLVQE